MFFVLQLHVAVFVATHIVHFVISMHFLHMGIHVFNLHSALWTCFHIDTSLRGILVKIVYRNVVQDSIAAVHNAHDRGGINAVHVQKFLCSPAVRHTLHGKALNNADILA